MAATWRLDRLPGRGRPAKPAGVRSVSGRGVGGPARGLGAAAYTVGSQIVFGAGYRGHASPSGRRLLVHELAHVVQQGGTRARPRAVAAPDGGHEAQAEQAGAGSALGLGGAPAGTI